MACPTLGDASTEEASSARHRHQRGDAHPASRLTKDGDVGGVTAKVGNVLLHPDERGDLVEHAEVGNAIPQGEEAIGSQTIVDGDADDAIAGEARAIIRWPCPRPVEKGAPMNPDHDRQTRLAQVRGPDVEIQTVLSGDSYLREEDIERREIGRLGCCRAIGKRFAHAIPGLRWPWRLKAVGTKRWRRVRNAFKCRHSISRAPLNSPLAGPDN